MLLWQILDFLREFVDRVEKYYVDTYGADSEQVNICSDGYYFESFVGSSGNISKNKVIFNNYMKLTYNQALK